MSTILRIVPVVEEDAGCSIPGVQPIPYYTKILALPGGSTAIQRNWNPGDHLRCRLCPLGRCVWEHGSCLIGVDRVVSWEEARTFDATGINWPPTGA